MTNDEKLNYKFTYLDSLLIANHMNKSLYETYSQIDDTISPYYQEFDADLSDEIIPVMRRVGENKVLPIGAIIVPCNGNL